MESIGTILILHHRQPLSEHKEQKGDNNIGNRHKTEREIEN